MAARCANVARHAALACLMLALMVTTTAADVQPATGASGSTATSAADPEAIASVSVGADGGAVMDAGGDAASRSTGESGSSGDGGGDTSAGDAAAPQFACKDGSAVVPVAYVDDDYCDCSDGSDEPSTAACSHLDVVFHCVNRGYLPGDIPSSRVDDGVCDCCDASDEPRSAAPCEDTCMAMGASMREEGVETLADLRVGMRVAVAEARAANATLQEWRDQAAKENESVTELEELLQQVELRRGDEELLEHEERKRRARAGPKAVFPDPDPVVCPNDTRKQRHNEAFATPKHQMLGKRLRTVQNCPTLRRLLETPFGTTPKRKLSDPDEKETFLTPKQQRKRMFLGPFINNGANGLRLLGHRLLQGTGVLLFPVRLLLQGAWWVLSNAWHYGSRAVGYVWMLIARVGGKATARMPELPALPPKLQLAKNRTMSVLARGYNATMTTQRQVRRAVWLWSRRSGVTWAFRTVWNAGPALYEYCFPTVDTSWVRPEAEELRLLLPSIRGAVAEARSRLSQVQSRVDKVQRGDFGDGLRFLPLHDVCISSHVSSYKYNVCFFKSVTQDSTSLGQWSGEWRGSDYTAQAYTNGASCWQNPARTAVVRLKCGAEREVVEVREPATCQYELEVRVPEACHAGLEEATRAQLKVLGMSSEDIDAAVAAAQAKRRAEKAGGAAGSAPGDASHAGGAEGSRATAGDGGQTVADRVGGGLRVESAPKPGV